MKRIFTLLLAITLGFGMTAQNDDPAGSLALTGITLTTATSLAATGCEATVRNLGATTSSPTPAAGTTMANDAWFHFVAVAGTAKIKVCSPTTFDAAIEVWNSTATTMLGSCNVGGSGAKEYLCVQNLVVGSTYKVRVGRVSGTGAGTFTISYEHLAVEVRNTYWPDPPGAPTCYDFTMNIQRSIVSFPTSGNTAHYKFVDENNVVIGPFLAGFQISLANCPGICEGHTYQLYIELQATDPECGTIWWGYSVPRPITMCTTLCPTLTQATGEGCGSTFNDILNTTFSASFMGTGVEYQFKFVTNNGDIEFISAWSTSPIFATSGYTSYFRYNKIYSVYIRARKCNNNPAWCGPCTFFSGHFPDVNVTSSSCCKWRNKSGGGNISCNVLGPTGVKYRFRFTPIDIDPCLSPNPLIPVGAAITSAWATNYYTNPGSLPLVLGTVYNVQAQARIESYTYTGPNGTPITIPEQTNDWGSPCMIGIRSSSSPAVGTPLTCYCTPISIMEDEPAFIEIESRVEPTVEDAPAPILVTGMAPGYIWLNTADAGLYGTGVLRVFDMSGHLVISRNLYAMETTSFVEIMNERLLPTGIYLVSVQSDTLNISDKVFIRSE